MEDPLLMADENAKDRNNSSQTCIACNHTNVEGECFIIKVQCLTTSFGQNLLFAFTVLISCGITLLICYWSVRFYAKIRFVNSTLAHSSHFLIHNSDNKFIIVPRSDVTNFNSEEDIEKVEDKNNNKCKQQVFNNNNNNNKKLISFVNRFLRYIYIEQKQIFECVQFDYISYLQRKQFQQNVIIKGLDEQNEVPILQKLYGSCEIDIPIPSNLFLLVKEVLHPFFVFQIYSILLWTYEQYYSYASVIFVISFCSAVINLIYVKQNLRKLREMAKQELQIETMRNGILKKLKSAFIVPGDVIALRVGVPVPCDCILLEGTAIVNESALTGESLPINKIAIQVLQQQQLQLQDNFKLQIKRPSLHYAKSHKIGENQDFWSEERVKKHTIFAGTTLLKISKKAKEQQQILNDNEKANLYLNFPEINVAPAIVIRTGFISSRGQLIRSILYPKPNQFQFFSDSIKFVIGLGTLSLLGFLIILPKIYDVLDTEFLFVKWFDLITISVSPALPAALQVGISYALKRLLKKDIFCISPPKVIVGGRVDTVCFDKTGTITEDGMSIKGVILSQDNMSKGEIISNIVELKPANNFNLEIESQQQSCFSEIFVDCMITCNNLVYNENQLSGDPMEEQLFQFTKAQILDFNDKIIYVKDIFFLKNKNFSYYIIKKFDFQSETQCMSVIIQKQFQQQLNINNNNTINDNNNRFALVKGAPEVILEMCGLKNNNIASEVEICYEKYANMGYRVLAFGFKRMEKTIQKYVRNEVEQNLIFLGFALFENKLKPTTIATVKQLKEACIQSVIVTGDNALTAIDVAKKSGIISPESEIIFFKLETSANFLNKQKLVFIKYLSSEYIEKEDEQSPDNKLQQQKRYSIKSFIDDEGNFSKDEYANNNNIDINQQKQQFSANLNNKNIYNNINNSDISTKKCKNFPLQQQFEQCFSQKDKYQRQIITEKSIFVMTGSLFEHLFMQAENIPLNQPNLSNIENHSKQQSTPTDQEAIPAHNSSSQKKLDLYPSILSPSLRIRLLSQCRIFARMKPIHKTQLISVFQTELNLTVAMCGDGANDCGALKQADVGLALSRSEASISAPFTSKKLEISAILDLLVQCRAGLSTNFQCFKFMALYSLIQYSTTLLNYYFLAMPSDYQYLYADLFTISSLFITMSLTEPVDKLSVQRPEASLLSKQCMVSVFGQVVLQFVAQVHILFLMLQYQNQDEVMIMMMKANFQNFSEFDQGAQLQQNAQNSQQQQQLYNLEQFQQQLLTQFNEKLQQQKRTLFAQQYQELDQNRAFYEKNGILPYDTKVTTTLFVFSNFILLASVLAFSQQQPFKKSFCTNYYFIVNVLVLWLFDVGMASFEGMRLSIFEFNQDLSQEWYDSVLLWAQFWILAIFAFETMVSLVFGLIRKNQIGNLQKLQ